MSEIKMKARRGKPRRAKGLTKPTICHIDQETKERIRREFGSLGNGLYFLAQGIEQTKAKHGIPTADPDPPAPALNRRDLELILKALIKLYDDCGGGPGVGKGNGGGRIRVQIEGVVEKMRDALESPEEVDLRRERSKAKDIRTV